MPLFNGDTTWRPFNISFLVAILIGAVVGYFFTNLMVLIFSAVLILLIILAAIDSKGKEICALFNYAAIQTFVVILLAMWIATITANHWWHLPKGILR